MRFNTPNFFLHLIRLLPTAGIEQVQPYPAKRWNGNEHVFATKSGSPYLVLRHNGMMFSICRNRGSRYAQWSYYVRWPYGVKGIRQQRYTTKYPQDVIRCIEQVAR